MDGRLTLDGKSVAFREGQTLLELAREHGAWVPSLCWHRKTGRAGRCRLCVVEAEGSRTLVSACTTQAREGMVVRTDSGRVRAARRGVVELMLANGEHNCISCERNGTCELQDAAYRLGIEVPSLPADPPACPADDSGVMIRFDARKCVLCGRCVAACNGTVVNEVLGTSSKGFSARIVFDMDLPMGQSGCVQCGECVQLCPVGALIDRKAVGKGRPWDLETVDTTCAYCGAGCQVTLHVDRARNRIVRVTGREVVPNDGMLCVKGRYGYEFPSSANRLTQPLIRENGVHRPASWDETLDYLAKQIRAIVDRHGPDSFSAFGSGRVTNENNYAMSKFTRAVIKTNNIDHCART